MGDEPIHVFIPGGKELWVPERLWFRLVHLGRAYDLHLLPLLSATAEVRYLNGQQAAVLVDEVMFVQGIVKDEALASWIMELQALLATASRLNTDQAVGLEGS